MNKRTLAKLGGFGIAAATTAALVGFAANGTGAYFTASSDGHANVSTGSVNVNTAGINGIDFTGLLPGSYKTQPITYNISGSTANEDVYLELPNDPALTAASTPGPDPLGRYGQLAVSGPAGVFSSYNLAADPGDATGETDASTASCKVDAYGRSADGVGQTTAAANHGDYSLPYCQAPQFILLSYNMAPTDPTATANITFGYTGLLMGPQNQSVSTMPIRVVAVQHGVSPTDVNNAPFT